MMLRLSLLCHMDIIKITLAFILTIVLMTNCSSLKINEAASTDSSIAINTINKIKATDIVVIFPTEHKKEKALIQFSKSKPSIQKDIEKLRSKRNDRLELWQRFKSRYAFSNLYILPDSLLKSYITNPQKAQIISEENRLEQKSIGEIYVLYTDYGGFEIKQNGQFIPNPFPNKIQPAWGSSLKDFFGVQSEEKSINRFFTELDKQLNLYYHLTQLEGN